MVVVVYVLKQDGCYVCFETMWFLLGFFCFVLFCFVTVVLHALLVAVGRKLRKLSWRVMGSFWRKQVRWNTGLDMLLQGVGTPFHGRCFSFFFAEIFSGEV